MPKLSRTDGLIFTKNTILILNHKLNSTESLEKIFFFFVCCHLKKFRIFPKYLKNTQAHAYARVYECRSPKSYACVAIAMKVTALCSCFCAKTLPCLCHFANEAHTLSCFVHNLPLTTMPQTHNPSTAPSPYFSFYIPRSLPLSL